MEVTPVPTRVKAIGMSVELAVKTPAPQRAGMRRKLAKAKKALSDGSFPIPNVAYLKKAIKAVGRAAPGKRPALARLIRKRGRELGAMNVVKGSWADNTQSAKAMSNALRAELELSGYTGEALRREMKLTLQVFGVVELARKRTQSTTAVQTAADQTKLEGPQPAVSKYASTASAASHKHTADAQADQLRSHPLYKRVHAAMRQRGMSNTQAHRLAARAVKLRSNDAKRGMRTPSKTGGKD